MGYTCFYFAGELNRPEERCILCPKAHFNHPEISSISDAVFGNITRSEGVTQRIRTVKQELTYHVRSFIRTFQAFNSLVLAAAAMLLSLERALYTLVYIYVNSYMLNLIVTGLSQRKAVFIISPCWQEISQEIFEKLDRGLTVIKGQGDTRVRITSSRLGTKNARKDPHDRWL